MSKQNFYTLLSRYRSGQCTEREKQLVERWFSLLDEEIPQRSRDDNRLLEEKLWEAVNARKKAETRSLFSAQNWKWIAAVFIVTLVSIWGISRVRTQSIPANTTGFAVQSNEDTKLNTVTAGEKGKSLILSDSSEIQLSANSTLEYPSSFNGGKREVYLKGKAFFKVTPDPEKPFFVYSDEIVTRVLGTSFWVDGSNPGNAIEVAVVTGRVSVAKREEAADSNSGPMKSGAILTANQKVKFSNESNLFEIGLVDQPVPVIPDENELLPPVSFAFADAPIAEVISLLEEVYGIEIILENEALKGCLFMGDITGQPLFTKLDLLCASVGAEYEIRGTRVLVSGKGCPDSSVTSN